MMVVCCLDGGVVVVSPAAAPWSTSASDSSSSSPSSSVDSDSPPAVTFPAAAFVAKLAPSVFVVESSVSSSDSPDASSLVSVVPPKASGFGVDVVSCPETGALLVMVVSAEPPGAPVLRSPADTVPSFAVVMPAEVVAFEDNAGAPVVAGDPTLDGCLTPGLAVVGVELVGLDSGELAAVVELVVVVPNSWGLETSIIPLVAGLPFCNSTRPLGVVCRWPIVWPMPSSWPRPTPTLWSPTFVPVVDDAGPGELPNDMGVSWLLFESLSLVVTDDDCIVFVV